MPVPTPPNKDLFKVTPPKEKRVTTQKTTVRIHSSPLVKDINPAVYPEKPTAKKPKFVPPEHLTQAPFRENGAFRKLHQELKKETDPKKPIKRSPRRKPATKKTTGEK